MEKIESLQLLKEQLKIKNRDLRKARKEKNEFAKRLNDLIAANQREIRNLRETVRRKDEEIKEQQAITWAARMAKHLGKEGKEDAAAEDEEARASKAARETADKEWIEKIERLRERVNELKEDVSEQKETGKKLEREKELLLRELKRLKRSTESTEDLRGRIDILKAQLRNARAATQNSGTVSEDLLKDKDRLIEKYEKMLYGQLDPSLEGMLPAEIIEELKEEVDALEQERVELAKELELIKEENSELESRLLLLEEQSESHERTEFRPPAESRVAATAEFSSGLENFLITYSDMITLLLVIFVLMYTVSKLDEDKFAEALSSFQEKEWRVDRYNVRLNSEEMAMLKRVRELVKDNVDPESLVRSDIRTILIRLKSSELFAPGSAELLDGADQLILEAVQEDIQEGVKQLRIDGHTDDVPIHSDKYPTNWELSAARASSVARVLIDHLEFPPDRIVVAGYGEHRPIKPNNSDKNRALNRRVEIKIRKDLEVAEEEKRKKSPESSPLNLPGRKKLKKPVPPVPSGSSAAVSQE